MKGTTIKITLEPELQIQAVTLSARECRKLAETYRRWAHQLDLKARIMTSAPSEFSPRRSMRPVARRLLPLN